MTMTILDLLKSPQFPSKNIIEKLICHSTGLSRTELFTYSERELSDEQETWIRAGYDAYTIQKQPLEYILGYVEFCWERFEVTSSTLIPRPETEYMILAATEKTLSDILEDIAKTYKDKTTHKNTEKKPLTLIDVGTGCGVLGLSVLIHHPWPISQAFLTDYSTDALTIAQKNYTQKLSAEKISAELPLHFVHSDLLLAPELQDALHSNFSSDTTTLLVANLPYIPEQTFEDNVEETVKKREPKMAFVGWDDGLDLYRRMFDQLIAVHTAAKSSSSILPAFMMYLEMMTRQVDILRNEYGNHFLLEEVATFHFNIRIVRGVFRN